MFPGFYPLIAQQSDGTALTTSTAETSIISPNQKITVGSQWFSVIGDCMIVEAAGRITTVTTPGTLTLKLKMGSVTICDSGALVLSTTAKTNVSWYARWLLTARAVGTAGNLMGQGIMISEALGATTVAGEAKCMCLPVSSPAVGSNVDFTASQNIDLTATWSINNADSIQTHQFVPFTGRLAA
jgi:hypothetical protein